jgi:hypothetical protein
MTAHHPLRPISAQYRMDRSRPVTDILWARVHAGQRGYQLRMCPPDRLPKRNLLPWLAPPRAA